MDYHPIDVIDVCFEWIKVKECLGDESMDGEVSASSISLEINDAVSGVCSGYVFMVCSP